MVAFKTAMVPVDVDVAIEEDAPSVSYLGLTGNNGITVTGTWTSVSPTTGVQSGVAGAGTTTVSIVKPTGESDWTANDLLGSFVRILAGPGVGAIRAIRSNTTTSISISAVSGLDNTSSFDIVVPERTISLLMLTNNQAPIVIQNCFVSAAVLAQNSYVSLINCLIDTPNAAGSILGNDNRVVVLSQCVLTSEASLLLDDHQRLSLDNLVLFDGSVRIRRAQYVNANVTARDCTNTALSLLNVVLTELGFSADDCDTTPLTMSSCTMMKSQGSGLVGNGNTGYGLTADDGGRYDVTGATLTGSLGDFTVDGVEDTYVALAAEGAILLNTTHLLVG